jgi:hypothetical protein
MKEYGIFFILIQIDEAHSSAWPIALENQPEPQKNIEERLDRANKFVIDDFVPFPVYCDVWENDFAETYQAWPDKYYMFDSTLTVLQKSEYGYEGDKNALIEVDCLDLIKKLLQS